MKARQFVLPLFFVTCCAFGRAQTAQNTTPHRAQPTIIPHNSGPLTWTLSDVNAKTVFWIQGRFAPVGDANFQGDAEVATILCSVREYECLEIDSESPFAHEEQVWIEDFKPVSWDKSGILATTRSLDGCTDETLKIRFSPPSVVIINSPVLPMSPNCRKTNGAMDNLMGKKGWAMTGQMEQDELVPTRTLLPWADADLDFGKAPTPAPRKNP